MLRCSYILSAFAMLVSAAALRGDVDLIVEEAGIQVTASSDGEGSTVSRNIAAGNALPFDEFISSGSATVNAQSSAAMYTYNASTATGLSLNADGGFDVSAMADGASEAFAVGFSGLSARFQIDRPASYSAIGNLFKHYASVLGEDDSLVFARLEQVDPLSGTPQSLWQTSADSGDTPVNISDILDGNVQYILTVQALGWVQAGSAATSKANDGTFQIDFSLTEFDAGDADLDGDVDLSDLGALATNYGATTGGTWTTGDFDYDADIDLADLGALASNYGAGSAQAAIDFQTLILIPEPLLALPALVALLLSHRRRV